MGDSLYTGIHIQMLSGFPYVRIRNMRGMRSSVVSVHVKKLWRDMRDYLESCIFN